MVGEAQREDTNILQSGKKRSRNTKVIYDENLFHTGLDETLVDENSSSSASGEESDDSFEPEEVLDEFDFSKELQNT